MKVVEFNIKNMAILIDIIGLIILALIYINFGYTVLKRKSYGNKLFDYLIITMMIIFIVDISIWFLIEKSAYYQINYVLIVIHFILYPVFLSFWVIYCDYQLYERVKRRYKLIPWLTLIGVVIGIIAIMSYKYPIFFNLSKDNVYTRGDYFFVFVLLCYLYIIFTTIEVEVKIKRDGKKTINYQNYRKLLFYPIFPTIGAIIQITTFGLNLTWLFGTISLIILFFNFQNAQLTLDPLTGINNRYKFDSYLEKQVLYSYREEEFFLILLDLDKFKEINDKYGHLEGDLVLKETAKILKKSKQNEDKIYRIGGDEFAVLGERKTESDVKALVDDIYDELMLHNKMANKKYDISFSIGYAVLDSQMKTSSDLVSMADIILYEVKNGML